jgi:hypothetical protein
MPSTTRYADFSRAARLRPAEFEACWAALDPGDPPLALPLPPPAGHTTADRDRLRRDALSELAARGLADRDGPVGPLADAVRLLAGAPVLCDLRLSEPAGGGELIVLGAAAREHGVVARASGAELAVLPVPGPYVPTTLVELAGPLTPARARPVNIPADLFDQALADSADLWTLADRLVACGVPSSEANSLARMCGGITAAGQLGVTVRVGGGDRTDGTGEPRAGERRGRWVVGFHRGRDGACLQLRRAGTVTVAPVDARKLLAQLTELIEATHPIHA